MQRGRCSFEPVPGVESRWRASFPGRFFGPGDTAASRASRPQHGDRSIRRARSLRRQQERQNNLQGGAAARDRARPPVASRLPVHARYCHSLSPSSREPREEARVELGGERRGADPQAVPTWGRDLARMDGGGGAEVGLRLPGQPPTALRVMSIARSSQPQATGSSTVGNPSGSGLQCATASRACRISLGDTSSRSPFAYKNNANTRLLSQK